MRTKLGKKDSQVEKMATLLEQASHRRNVKMVLRQRQSNVLDVKVSCTTSNRADRFLKVYTCHKSFPFRADASFVF